MVQELGICVSGLNINIQSYVPVQVDDTFLPFLQKQIQSNGWHCIIASADSLEYPQGRIAYSGDGVRIIAKDGCFHRFIIDSNRNLPYVHAVTDAGEKSVQLSILKEFSSVFHLKNLIYYIGWENILEIENRLFLHAACVETAYGGILFVGPSGIGKSTQADLWCRFRNAELVNGDRTICVEHEDGWHGWGSPNAGSSLCFRNVHCKIRAVVVLKREKDRYIKRIGGAAAFQSLFAELTINTWNPRHVEHVADLLMSVVEKVPVYQMSCTADETAIDLLEEVLRPGGDQR